MATFVLVHGAWGGAWVWHKVVPLLEDRGHEAITLDLPAHGIDRTPWSEVTLASYVDRVAEALDNAGDEPTVLVGHSLGGVVVTQTAERRPEAIDTLVYLTAFLPVDGQALVDVPTDGGTASDDDHGDGSDAGDDAGDDAGPGTEFDEERGVLVQGNDPEALVARTYADCSRADRELALSLRPREEPLAGVTTPVDVSQERFGSVRRTYVVCERDRAIPPAAQRRMIEDRGVDATASVEASHSPFLSVPVELVDALESVGLPD